MQKNLVIVESPAKAKTIEKFLGGDYKVMSSYGHIRDLKKREISIDEKTMEPQYEIPADKKKVVAQLKSEAKKAEKVWLASDEDREGEAISWHLCEVLGLDQQQTSRIVFHEITKPAILKAIEQPRMLDMNLVNAQQARRVLDRLVGFKLSPVLWRKVKPALSAGRVQSVAVRLIVDREREIQKFKSEPYYALQAVFTLDDNGKQVELKATLDHRLKSQEEVDALMQQMKQATFTVDSVQKKPVKRSPAPPFTTSTLQQEAARKLGFTVSQTMLVAQHLYENGHITYMRTDSVNLSSLCLNTAKTAINALYGEKYSHPRQFHTHAKGAQEAHEAIRPTYMDRQTIEAPQQEQRLYELIWKRTAASQMADAELEKTTITIEAECGHANGDNSAAQKTLFTATGEVVTFDGFLKVYRPTEGDDTQADTDEGKLLPPMHKGQSLERMEMTATERFSTPPARYTEASLVHKMEELGIGRPSTYAPTISTIQQREYVQKGDTKGQERSYTITTLKGQSLTHRKKSEMAGSDKGKLLPTDIGLVVNDFLMQHFPNIMDYSFTANVEQDFDRIAEGKEQWEKMMKAFYKKFEPTVEQTLKSRSEHKAGERVLGNDPETGRPVMVKIGRFGPVVQKGTADEKEKPVFAQLPKKFSMEAITLEEALELFRLPRKIGEYEGKTVTINTGRFGPYAQHDGKYTSLGKDFDPMTITLEEAIGLIEAKRKKEAEKHIKSFDEKPGLEVLNGRWGPYIVYEGKNYRLTKQQKERAKELTLEECLEIVKA